MHNLVAPNSKQFEDEQTSFNREYLKQFARSPEYKEILERRGFKVHFQNELGAIHAHGHFNYVVNGKEIDFELDAYGNSGLTFWDSLAVEIPWDVLKVLKARHGDKICGKDRVSGRIPIPDFNNYCFLKGSKEQMEKELETVLIGIAEIKYGLEYGFTEQKPSESKLLEKICGLTPRLNP